MVLSDEQKNILESIAAWHNTNNSQQYISLGGYAGTGKTTLVPFIIETLNKGKVKQLEVALCSYTGRAALNLKNQLHAQKTLSSKNKVSTIHGLIYNPIENKQGVIEGWVRKNEIEADLIIVDEASMVDGEIWQDLLSFKVPIIAIGDHGQLFPIRGNFNLMEKPHLKLETIHRQAKDNPIISLATLAREHGMIPPQVYGKKVIKYARDDQEYSVAQEDLLTGYNNDTLIICGYNKTRNNINQYVRQALGFESSYPQVGDRVVCLRNNHEKRIYNGMVGTLSHIKSKDKDWYEADVEMDDAGSLYSGMMYKPQFNAPTGINFTDDRIKAAGGDLFDFGYALTVHKAQGSQAKRVILFEERFPQMDENEWRRWLYTAVTRAEKELYIFGR